MGRWGWRLFEADRDIDIACDLPMSVGIKNIRWKHGMSSMIHQTDMLAPREAREYYKTEEYKRELENETVPYVRGKLDRNGTGDRIFDACRAKEIDDGDALDQGIYRTIIFGALMMRAGAKIRDQDLQHLRELVPQIHCSTTYALPIFDMGFRSPGRAQFLAALDHYQAGVARSFAEMSCFHCGQIKSDIGHTLRQCGRCKVASYCDTECQRDHWQEHKPNCIRPEKRRMINV